MIYKHYQLIIRKNQSRYFSLLPYVCEIQDTLPKSNEFLWGKVMYGSSPKEAYKLGQEEIDRRESVKNYRVYNRIDRN